MEQLGKRGRIDRIDPGMFTDLLLPNARLGSVVRSVERQKKIR